MGQRFWRGRWPVVWAVVAVVIVFGLGWLVIGTFDRAWHFLGVPSMSPPFADLRTITHSIDCVAKGLDPFTIGACDPWGRLYNYPSIWLHLGAIGISSASSNLIGILFIALLCATLLLIYETRTVVSGIIAFAAVISPPTLLLVERGNIDVLMFSATVVASYYLAKRSGLCATLLQCGVIVLLAVLKIYPIGSATVLAHRRWGLAGIALTGALTMIGLLGLVGLEEIKTIAMNTPQVTYRSYGDVLIFLRANEYGLVPNVLSINTLRAIAAMTALSLAGIAILVSLRRPGILRSVLPALDPASTIGAVAMSCVSIFCFSFILGSNYNYRLVFLLGVLPVLLTAHDTERRAGTIVAPAAIVLFLWVSAVSWRHVVLPFEILDWSIFAIGVMWVSQAIFAQRRNEVDPDFEAGALIRARPSPSS
jgi:hypothetical protein